jgi:hypothetical protein
MRGRNLDAEFDGAMQGARERRIAHDRHAVILRDRADPLSQSTATLGRRDRSGPRACPRGGRARSAPSRACPAERRSLRPGGWKSARRRSFARSSGVAASAMLWLSTVWRRESQLMRAEISWNRAALVSNMRRNHPGRPGAARDGAMHRDRGRETRLAGA